MVMWRSLVERGVFVEFRDGFFLFVCIFFDFFCIGVGFFIRVWFCSIRFWLFGKFRFVELFRFCRCWRILFYYVRKLFLFYWLFFLLEEFLGCYKLFVFGREFFRILIFD